jgi:hypothetical protein
VKVLLERGADPNTRNKEMSYTSNTMPLMELSLPSLSPSIVPYSPSPPPWHWQQQSSEPVVAVTQRTLHQRFSELEQSIRREIDLIEHLLSTMPV